MIMPIGTAQRACCMETRNVKMFTCMSPTSTKVSVKNKRFVFSYIAPKNKGNEVKA